MSHQTYCTCQPSTINPAINYQRQVPRLSGRDAANAYILQRACRTIGISFNIPASPAVTLCDDEPATVSNSAGAITVVDDCPETTGMQMQIVSSEPALGGPITPRTTAATSLGLRAPAATGMRLAKFGQIVAAATRTAQQAQLVEEHAGHGHSGGGLEEHVAGPVGATRKPKMKRGQGRGHGGSNDVRRYVHRRASGIGAASSSLRSSGTVAAALTS